MGDSEEIDYASMDVEIRKLVWLLNNSPGIRTQWSCAGHPNGTRLEDKIENQGSYVVFTAASTGDLEQLLRRMPFLGVRTHLREDGYGWRAVTVEASLYPAHALRFTLRISGHPLWAQRQTLEEVERELEKQGVSEAGKG